MLERYLIEHCSPTLASVKTANLFTWSFAPEEMPEQQVRYWNQELQARGISLVVLRVQNQKALMYVCRKQRLQERLDDQEVQNFLGKYGYVQKDADYALQRLKERLAKAEGFPHEIGVFLDYPLEEKSIEDCGSRGGTSVHLLSRHKTANMILQQMLRRYC